jgi:hypothetical protein
MLLTGLSMSTIGLAHKDILGLAKRGIQTKNKLLRGGPRSGLRR